MRIDKPWIILALTALISVSLATCVDQSMKYPRDALLFYLKIGDVEVEAIPKPISEIQWNNKNYSLAGADFATALFNTGAETTNKRVIAEVEAGSRAEWGIATRGTRPGIFYDIRVPITFSDQDCIYIRVDTSDNTTSYYRVYTRLKSYVTDLNQISIGDRVGKTNTETSEGGRTPEEATCVWYTYKKNDKGELILEDGNPIITGGPFYSVISITVAESQEALVTALTYDENATAKYAVVRDDDPAPAVEDFTPPDVPLNIYDQDWLYVEVTAQNTVNKSYFKFHVDVGRMATIKTLKFVSGSKEIEVYGKGVPSGEWSTVTTGAFSTAKDDQPSGGFGFIIEPDDPLAKVSFLNYAYGAAGTPSFGAPNPGEKLEFASGDSLAIKVVSPNQDDIIRYYRVRVTLSAANIVQQPKSTWYYSNATAEPLSVVLDPPDTGQYTYEWYEADSWYGIYGRHGYGVDEKANISCVNGGPGQYFYIVQPDVIPSGGPDNKPQADEPFAWTVGTGKTYTPKTTWRNAPPPGVTANTKPPYPGTGKTSLTEAIAAGYKPSQDECYYLQGGTTETRYYWVKVTNTTTNLTITSDRAVILTESDRSMKHFVFDLSLLPYRKNLNPFTKKNEVFQIDLTNYPFPADFDPGIYQICIAHAQYFLPDGRPWTQNWTHGDLHFGYTEGSASFKKNGGPLTWWHNNMGANSGSIPLQAPHSARGGLEYKPDWIGFAPSGDPEKGIPAPDPLTGDLPKGIYSMDAKDPYPAGVAQGYFAGFIELLEIHFSTPPKN